MTGFVRKTLRRYCKNTDGHFGVWIGIMALPLMLAATSAVDYKKATSHEQNMKSALDAAALAAASNNMLTDSQKVSFAKQIFNNNYVGQIPATVTAKVNEDSVEVVGTIDVPTTLGGAVGFDSLEVTERSVAIMDRKNTICVLSLAEDGADRISFLEQTAFNSPTCVVQSNSVHAEAMVSDSISNPTAKAFCSAGGASGAFDPYVRGECKKIEDPYAERKVPVPGNCVSQSIFKNNNRLGFGPTASLESRTLLQLNRGRLQRLQRKFSNNLLDVGMSKNKLAANQILFPGTYCGGLTVDTRNVTFMPGNYIMKDGALTIRNGAEVYADRVTFIMHGNESVVTIEDGASMYLKAPKMGEMAGLAIVQDVDSIAGGPDTFPNGVNLISSGGNLNVIGAMYFPTQAIDVSGDSAIGAQAPATSFIAYEVAFAGSTQANVRVDHVAAGLPPILPKSDDAARLIE